MYQSEQLQLPDRDLALFELTVRAVAGRGTPFFASIQDDGQRRQFWIHANAPMRFEYEDDRTVDVDPWHLDLAIAMANSDEGITFRRHPQRAGDRSRCRLHRLTVCSRRWRHSRPSGR